MTEFRIDESLSAKEPRRLIDGDDRIAVLLQGEKCRHPGPAPTFSQLRAASARRQWGRTVLTVCAVAMPLAAIVIWPDRRPAEIVAEENLIALESHMSEPATPEITKEAVAPRLASESEPTAKRPGEPKEVVAAPLTTDSNSPADSKDGDSPEDSDSQVRGTKATPVKQAKSVSTGAKETAPVVRPTDCSSFSRSGKFEQALKCLKQGSRESGMSAELALLESARLRRHVTGDLSGALTDLETYKSRFPLGALRREAGLLQLDVLIAIGQNESARRAIARLLPEVPEQQTALLQQAVELDIALKNCSRARTTVEKLESLGAPVERLRARLKSCESSETHR